MRWVNNFRKSITHSNLLAGLLGCSAVHSTYILHPNIEPNWKIYLFLFAGAWGVYILQRVMPHFISTPKLITERHHWFAKHKISMGICVLLLGSITAVIGVFTLQYHSQLFSVLLGSVALAYGARFKIGSNTFNGLRSIGGFKIGIVALVWTGLTGVLPLVEASYSEWGWYDVLYLISRFCMCVAITIPFDIRDIELDQQHQVPSLIAHLGVQRSRYLGIILCILAACLCVFGGYEYASTNLLYYVALLSLVYGIIFWKAQIESSSDAYLYRVFDSFLLYEAVILTLFSN